MRSYQPVGLIAGAKNWVEENCVKEPDLVCPDCHCVISTRLKVLEVHYEDCFDGAGPSLKTWETKDGKKVREKIQCSPWSSGPIEMLVVFHYLEVTNSDGTVEEKFRWTDEEMDSYL